MPRPHRQERSAHRRVRDAQRRRRAQGGGRLVRALAATASRSPPVDGMPIAVKDVIETADMPTGQGSPMWEGNATRRDSAAVRALREAGGVILGKTTTTEFAATHPWHKTQNPHDGTRTPGGSSSGSAAAVGSGMVPAGARHPGGRLDPAAGKLLRLRRLQAERRRRQPQRLVRSLQPELPGRHRRHGRRHLGPDHHDHRTHRRRSRPCRRHRHGELRQARRSRSGWPSWKPAAGAPPPRARARRSRRAKEKLKAAGVEIKSRADDPGPGSGREASRRRAAADPEHQRVRGPLAAQHLCGARRRQAQRSPRSIA